MCSIQLYVREVTVGSATCNRVDLNFTTDSALDVLEDVIPYLSKEQKEQAINLLNE